VEAIERVTLPPEREPPTERLPPIDASPDEENDVAVTEEPEIEPPVIVGFWIAIPERLSMRLESAIVLV
jgi:hypothetical protein